MAILGRWNDRPITLSVKPNCLTISVEQVGQSEVYSFDYTGRLWTAMLEGVSYRRGLDGKVVAKWSPQPAEHARRWLGPDESDRLLERARATVDSLRAAIGAGSASLSAPLDALAQRGLAAAAAFTAGRYAADVAGYHRVYKPVGILPPDQYMAVVLQATEGCSFNTCTFCDFYKDRPFRIKPRDAFLEHARAVKAMLGEGLSLRRTIFFGDANALVTPMPRLLDLFEVAHQVYDVEQLGGIYAFLDGFSGEKKTAADYAALRERGLKRVYSGMETGDAALLRQLRKPGKPQDAVAAAQAMKSAGVPVGVIVLLGAGGHAYAKDHVQATVQAINAMQLDLDDIVYFSELIENEGLEYTRDAYQNNWQPLSPAERVAQGDAIEQALVFAPGGGTPHISRYDIREFVY